jgi:hypothetical protein
MERRDQGLPSESSQMATGERDYTPAQMRALMAVVQQLVSEPDAGESDQRETIDGELILSLEQLASKLRRRETAMAPSHESDTQPRQPPAPSEDAQASAEPSGEQATEEAGPESNHSDSSGESTGPEVVMGSLRRRTDGSARCPRAPRAFTASKTAKSFAVWSQRIE